MDKNPLVCLGGNIAGKMNICAKAERRGKAWPLSFVEEVSI